VGKFGRTRNAVGPKLLLKVGSVRLHYKSEEQEEEGSEGRGIS